MSTRERVDQLGAPIVSTVTSRRSADKSELRLTITTTTGNIGVAAGEGSKVCYPP